MNDHVTKPEFDGVRVAVNKLEGRVTAGFDHMERKLDSFDAKYARNESVHALHEKAYSNGKEISKIQVKQEIDYGNIKAEVAKLTATIKVWGTAGGVIMGIVYFVLGKFL